MADELQALLNKIADETLAKAEGDKEQILADAKKEAENILQNARNEADEIINNAKREAQILERKGHEALQQASRDVLLSLRGTLNERIKQVALELTGKSLSGNELGTVLARLIENFLKQGGDDDRIEILLNENDLAVVDNALAAALSDDLRKRCELAPSASVNAGFKLVFTGNDVVYDFTDKALADTISTRLGSKLSSIISAAY